MLSRQPSAHQRPAESPAVTPIGVGIDTSRYGHYAAFLGPDLQTAAADLEVLESAAGYARLRHACSTSSPGSGRSTSTSGSMPPASMPTTCSPGSAGSG